MLFSLRWYSLKLGIKNTPYIYSTHFENNFEMNFYNSESTL